MGGKNLDLSELLDFANGIAVRASGIAEAHQINPNVQAKASPQDLLTAGDAAVQEFISEAILNEFPNDGFLGEEKYGNRRGTSGRTWIVDPIDGSNNYAIGNQAIGVGSPYAISIACVDEGGNPLVAAVALPKTGDMLLAAQDMGATANGHPISVREDTVLDGSTTSIALGSSYEPELRAREAAMYQHLHPLVGGAVATRCVVADLCTVAAGQTSGFMHGGMKAWDIAAAVLLTSEAGGVITTSDTTEPFGGGIDPAVADYLKRSIEEGENVMPADLTVVTACTPELGTQLVAERRKAESLAGIRRIGPRFQAPSAPTPFAAHIPGQGNSPSLA